MLQLTTEPPISCNTVMGWFYCKLKLYLWVTNLERHSTKYFGKVWI
jgi:hypothetical protein